MRPGEPSHKRVNMLDSELFIGFLLATSVLILMPGPIVTLVVANSLAHGRRTGLATVAGASSGNAVLVAAGALGLTTLLALAADLLVWVRWIGVAYLVWLGLKEWRRALQAKGDGPLDPTERPRGVFWYAALIAITNPKTILFYAAFFPQFLDPSLAAGPQLLAMSIGFIVIATTFDGLYALLASRLRGRLMNSTRARIRHGISGTLLIGTGLGLALARRS